MSRFYQALKEASRYHQNTNGDAGGKNHDGLDGIDLLSVVNELEVRKATALVTGLADESLVVSRGEEIPLAVSSQNGTFGTAAKVVLDQKARLIPHAVDPVIVEHYRTLRTKIL